MKKPNVDFKDGTRMPANPEKDSGSPAVRNIAMALVILAPLITNRIVTSVNGGALSSTASTQTQPVEAEKFDLVAALSFDREILARQIHIYRLKLQPGQCLSLVIEKQDLGVGLMVLEEDGRAIVDLCHRRYGPIKLSLIANTVTMYRCEVRSLEEGAGHYRIRVAELRAATERDSGVISAQASLAEAEKLRSEWKQESFNRCLKKYQEASDRWHDIGAPREQASALKNMGEVHCILASYKNAIQCFERSLVLYREAGDAEGECEALNDIAATCTYVDQNQKALEHAKRALALSQTNGYRRDQGRALNNLGEVYYLLSETDKALDAFNQACEIWKTETDRQAEARTLINIGYTRYDLRDMQKAIDYYDRALSLYQQTGELRGQALAFTAIGSGYSNLGEKQTAIEFHTRAVELFRTIGDRGGQAIALTSAGYLYADMNDHQRALDFYNRGLALTRSVGSREHENLTLLYIGRAYYSLGDNRNAINHFRQVLSGSRKFDYRITQATALNCIGIAYTASKKQAAALDYYDRALKIYREIKDRSGEAYALDNAGYAHESLGNWRKAMACYTRALPLSRLVGDIGAETLALRNLARLERDRGNLDTAKSLIEASLKIIESMRTKVASHDLRTSYFASVHEHYDTYIDVLMELHKRRPSEGLDAVALVASEHGRARSLLDSLAEVRHNIGEGVDSGLIQREESLQQQIEARLQLLVQLRQDKKNEGPTGLVEKELNALIDERRETNERIRALSPRYAALTVPQPLSLEQIRNQVLDSETLLIEYALCEKRSYLWLVSRSEIKSFVLPGRAIIEATAKRVRDLISSSESIFPAGKAEYWKSAAALSRMILSPIASQLGHKRLLVVAEGALQYVPFQALPILNASGPNARSSTSPLRPMIEEHEIVSLPSASVVAALRAELATRKPAEKGIAVFADPVFEPDDERVKPVGANRKARAAPTSPESSEINGVLREFAKHGLKLERLKSSRTEAGDIKSMSSESMIALDFDANLAKVRDPDLHNYRIIHFATHGLLDSNRPDLSCIALSMVNERGDPQNGFLLLNDIYNLELSADLVVLSACSTALGKDMRGEGLVGLTRGFMYAGAARVMASLWNVDDQRTAELMKRFYEKILKEKMQPAAALRAAQLEMWRSKSNSPYYWGAFVLQGEWKDSPAR